jgi:hypothetical protein
MTNNFPALYENQSFIIAFKTASNGPHTVSFRAHSLLFSALYKEEWLASGSGRHRPKKETLYYPPTSLGKTQSRFGHLKNNSCRYRHSNHVPSSNYTNYAISANLG